MKKLTLFLKGNRKFYIALGLSAVQLVLLLCGTINPALYVDIMKTLIVAYMSTNVGEHIARAIKGVKKFLIITPPIFPLKKILSLCQETVLK